MLDPAKLTISLCEIPSITGDENKVCHFVSELLEKNGFTVEHQKLINSDRFNIFAYKNESVPKILLTTHLDTVPPFIAPQISPDGEWLIGRGVCDAKGIAAAMICSLINPHGRELDQVALLFVVGEETISDGAKWAAQTMKQRFEFVINGEPTDLRLAESMKGAVVFELVSQGIAGHSAYPKSGDSAVHRLIYDTQRILDHKWPKSPAFGETTINVGRFEGGEAANVIAEKAKLSGVIRLSCSVKDASQQLASLLDSKTTLNVLSTSEPRKLLTLETEETCQVSFGCDIPHLEKLGTPLLFGPGSILDAHTDFEKIRIADLELASLKYAEICRHLLSLKS